MTFQSGQKLSHYRLVEKIGAGGMGVVWKADDTVLSRTVAIKVLPQDLCGDERRRRMFLEEARLASSISDAHIVEVHEFGHEGDLDFIVMEYVEGNPLSKILHGRPLPAHKVADYGHQVALALARAHRKGLLHRDLKPGNILVTPEGEVKVVDFGLATLFTRRDTTVAERVAGFSQASTKTMPPETGHGEEIAGTLPYMSPEQVRGEKLDARSDVFSLGAVLYEMTTGHQPFRGATAAEVAATIQKARFCAVHDLVPQVPLDLDRSIRKALSVRPGERYQTMDDLAVDLKRLSRDLESGSSPSYQDIASPKGRKRRWLGLTVVVLAVVLATIAIRGFLLREPAPFQSMRMASVANGNDIGTAALSPDGRYLALARKDGQEWRVDVRQVATGAEVQVLPPQNSPVTKLMFSVDGEYLYYIKNVDFNLPNLFRIPSLGGTERKISDLIDAMPAFSPDGSHSAFVRTDVERKEVSLVVNDMGSGAERILATVEYPPEVLRGTPAWSPDGQRIAVIDDFYGKSNHSQIITFDATTGHRDAVGSKWAGQINSMVWPKEHDIAISALDTSSFRNQLWHVSWPDGAARRITNDLNDYGAVSSSGDGSTLAAVRESRTSSLWELPMTGAGGSQELTLGSRSVSHISGVKAIGDGSIVFAAEGALWAMQHDGGSPRQISPEGQLARGGGGIWHLAEDHAVVYEAMDANLVKHIWRVDISGENAVQLTHGGGEALIMVSPGGEHLIYVDVTSPEQIGRVPTSGGEPDVVAGGFAVLGIPPKISPDGTMLYVPRVRDALGHQILVILPMGGGGDPLATFELPPGASWVDWAPDSKALTFVQNIEGVRTLMRWPIAGGDAASLFLFPGGPVYGLQWSPDGRTLLFGAWAGRKTNLWIWRDDGRGLQQSTDFRVGEIFPFDWEPDGKGVCLVHYVRDLDVVLIRDSD